MAIRIRVATRGELELLPEALGPKHHEFFLDRYPLQERGLGEILLAFTDGRTVGAVFISWDVAPEPQVRQHLAEVPMIFHLHVAPEWRHQGIGQALLRQAEQSLRDRGHKRVLLGVNKSNETARDLYVWLGYRQPAEPELSNIKDTPEPGGTAHAVGEAYDILVADLYRAVPQWTPT